MVLVTPAYGRVYKTAREAREAWESGKDFILNDLGSRWNGKPCSIRDFPGQQAEIRYGKDLSKLTVV